MISGTRHDRHKALEKARNGYGLEDIAREFNLTPAAAKRIVWMAHGQTGRPSVPGYGEDNSREGQDGSSGGKANGRLPVVGAGA